MNSLKAVSESGAGGDVDGDGGEGGLKVGEEDCGDVECAWLPETEESWKTSRKPYSS
jgi:hypothetical protein